MFIIKLRIQVPNVGVNSISSISISSIQWVIYISSKIYSKQNQGVHSQLHISKKLVNGIWAESRDDNVIDVIIKHI